jgi:prolyl-tRNA synthetase
MRYTRAFIPTVKEVPKDATTPSHVLLLRAGCIRMVGAGIYEMLPLGLRVLRKIERVIREEMSRAGCQEVLMPALLPSEYFKETGRWEAFGPTLLRLEDRKGGEYHLGPTHEEIITDMVRREVRSYRQLPLNLYQIQMKFRDEPRPRAGLLRCREFLMKDAYSFDVSEERAHESYRNMRDAYHRIFRRIGVDYRVVEADTGAMGGSTSAEFQVLAQNGEDAIVACRSCDYAANVEIAEAHYTERTPHDRRLMAPVEKVPTPGVHTIPELVGFLKDGVRPENTLKSLLYVAGDQVVMAVVRGDRELNETKLARHLGLPEVHMASESEVREATGAAVGFAGPVGFDGSIVADREVAHVLNAVAGANETDAHLRNVNHGRDFHADLADLRMVSDDDACPQCGGQLTLYRGIEGGHIFVLGTHYSAAMGATYLDEAGNELPIVMGCYGIGVSRLVAAIVEQHHDDDGIRWPAAVAPHEVLVTPLGKDGEVAEAAARIYQQLVERGVDALLDDRDDRPGVKFKDADLIGIPLRITVGARALKEGQVELKRRADTEATRVVVGEAAATAHEWLQAMMPRPDAP